jgi:pimeloyl-ACP methyl ester carboxylesterase
MGAAASLAAATRLQPPVAGVISLSSPTVYPAANALGAVPKLAVPVLYLVGETDGRFAANAQELYAQTPAGADRELVVVKSSAHGIQLMGQPGAVGTQVKAAMDGFLAANAPATG